MEINEELHKLCPGTDGGEDLADSLGMASQGAKRHVPMFGRQYHLFDVGHLGGRELAGAGSRARGAIVQTASRRGGPVPSVVSAGLEMRDTQDHGEREEWFCTGDGTRIPALVLSSGSALDRCRWIGARHHPFQGVDVDAVSEILSPSAADGERAGRGVWQARNERAASQSTERFDFAVKSKSCDAKALSDSLAPRKRRVRERGSHALSRGRAPLGERHGSGPRRSADTLKGLVPGTYS